MTHSEQSQRFNPVFSGYEWYVVDAFSQNWYPMKDKTHAEDRAQAWEYEVQECLDGRDRFNLVER